VARPSISLAFMLLLMATLAGQCRAQTLLDADRCLKKGSCYYTSGRYTDAMEPWIEGLRIAEIVGSREVQALFHANLGILARRRGDPENARYHLDRARSLNKEIASAGGEAFVELNLSALYREQSGFDKAIATAEHARSLYAALGDGVGMAKTFILAGLAQGEKGDPEAAMECLRSALPCAETKDSIGECVLIYNGMGLASSALGDQEKALWYCEKALNNAEILQDQRALGCTGTNRAHILEKLGNPRKAEESFQGAIKALCQTDDTKMLGRAHLGLAALYGRLDKFEPAMEHLESARLFVRDAGDIALMGRTMEFLGALYFSQHEEEKARVAFMQSLDIAESRGDEPLVKILKRCCEEGGDERAPEEALREFIGTHEPPPCWGPVFFPADIK
jgi:tetratricopeptide (TPR) repeat protein